MSGNCAMGSRKTITAPAMTKKIAATIATMGRSMKNLDMKLLLPSWVGTGRRGSWHERRLFSCDDRLHFHSILDLLRSVGNDAFPWLEPLVNHPQRARLHTRSHRPHQHTIIRADDGDFVLSLKRRDGGLRDEQRIVLDFGLRAELGVHARTA